MKGSKVGLLADQFDALCVRSEAAYGEELDYSYESALLDILNFVKQHPDARDELAEQFKKPTCPIEAVAFCMRELQWPEIKSFFVKRMGSSDDPRTQALLTVVSAYDVVWPDADLYGYYSSK